MIPISEDELTNYLWDRCASRTEARRLARLMLASEQMYDALKQSAAALRSFRVGYYEEDAESFRSRLGDIACAARDVVRQDDSALSAAEGRKA